MLFKVLVFAMLSTASGWALPSNDSLLLSNESTNITDGVDGARDRRHLQIGWGHENRDHCSCDRWCNESCDGFFGSCDRGCDKSCDDTGCDKCDISCDSKLEINCNSYCDCRSVSLPRASLSSPQPLHTLPLCLLARSNGNCNN